MGDNEPHILDGASLTWLMPGRIAACAYPRSEQALASLAERGIALLINLHERSLPTTLLARYRLRQLHLPVIDFTPPAPDQLAAGIAALDESLARGEAVVVHCGAGLGRTGTLLACWLVSQGLSGDEAIAGVRVARPGSVETPGQVAAIMAFADARRGESG